MIEKKKSDTEALEDLVDEGVVLLLRHVGANEDREDALLLGKMLFHVARELRPQISEIGRLGRAKMRKMGEMKGKDHIDYSLGHVLAKRDKMGTKKIYDKKRKEKEVGKR